MSKITLDSRNKNFLINFQRATDVCIFNLNFNLLTWKYYAVVTIPEHGYHEILK